MSEPVEIAKGMRVAVLLALFVLVIVAPLVGVYAFSPFFFVSGIEPYQLAVAVGVMLAEALAVGALAWLVIRAPK